MEQMDQTKKLENEIARLTELVTKMQRGGITNLAAAYVKAWGAVDNVVKNKDNPHFGSTYADLSAVLDTVRPVFSEAGLAILTVPGVMDGDKLSLQWFLVHTSGEHLSGVAQLPIGAKATAQAGGSCITYLRRYVLAAIAGVAQTDDDGNAASESPKGGKRAKSTPEDAPDYNAKAEALIARIKATTTVEEVDKLKPELAEFGDQRVVDEFAAHKKALKKAGAK